MEIATQDFYLTAYLRLNGQRILHLKDEGRRHLFVFEDTEELQRLRRDYYYDEATVAPQIYKRSIRELKALIYED